MQGMLNAVLLDQNVFVTYSQAWVYLGEDLFAGGYDLSQTFEGQTNGLCGAAQPDVLELITGTHTGDVPFRIELHDSEPQLGDQWEEVVEASFAPTSAVVSFTGLDSGRTYRISLPRREYRVRYCLYGMDDTDTTDKSSDAYLLQFWPAEHAPDCIVRQTSRRAASWHRSLNSLEQADDEQRERRSHERELFGDRVPNERLRNVQGLYAADLTRLDIDLAFALSETDDTTHRAVAAWATLRSLEHAGLIDLPSIAPAVKALQHGKAVPRKFRDMGGLSALLEAAQTPRSSVPAPPDGEYEQCSQDWAIGTLSHSANPDSLTAALDALFALAFVCGRDGYRQAFAEVRERFSQLID
jgi:hypothetical protein